MKQAKKMILGFLALAMTVSFAACTNNNKDGGQTANEPSKSFSEMAEELGGEIEAATMEADETILKDIYHLDLDKVEEAKAYMAMMNVHADDLVLVKAKSEEDAKAVEESLKQRNADSVETWKQYLPDQYELVQNYKLERKGNYVFYTVSEKADDLAKKFQSYFEK